MTAKMRNKSSITLYISAVMLLGALGHMLFIKAFGSWYDGLAHYMGFSTTTIGMSVVFLISAMTGFSAEAYFGIRSSFGRVVCHMITGVLVVPLGIMAILVLSPVSLPTTSTLILVVTELFFALAVWSVVLISGGLVWEAMRLRR